MYAAKHNRQRGVDALVLDDRGATEVRRPRTREAVMPVGWVSDSSLAWLVWHETKGTVDAARVQVTDDHGRLQRTVRLDVGRGVGDLSQWAGVVSPDGRTLALGATAQEHRTAVHFYDLTTGRLRSTMPGVPDAAGVCLPSWGDGTLQVPTENSLRDTVLRSINGSTTILADPRLGAGCSLWATDALDGPAHAGLGGTIFGDSTSWLSWHWREIAAGAAGDWRSLACWWGCAVSGAAPASAAEQHRDPRARPVAAAPGDPAVVERVHLGPVGDPDREAGALAGRQPDRGGADLDGVAGEARGGGGE